jgi:hypothetical protein
LISSKCDICLRLIYSSRSEEMPKGDAGLAWKNMVARFAPTTKANLIKTKKDFMASKLDDIVVDPDKWIQNLELMGAGWRSLGTPCQKWMSLFISSTTCMNNMRPPLSSLKTNWKWKQ